MDEAAPDAGPDSSGPAWKDFSARILPVCCAHRVPPGGARAGRGGRRQGSRGGRARRVHRRGRRVIASSVILSCRWRR